MPPVDQTDEELELENNQQYLQPALEPIQPRRSGQTIKPPIRYDGSSFSTISCSDEPSSFEEATRNSKEDWIKAMQAEMNTMNAWKIMPQNRDMHVIGREWVFKTKVNPDNQQLRFSSKGLLSNSRDRL